jgi:signal transduction histidine kinase
MTRLISMFSIQGRVILHNDTYTAINIILARKLIHMLGGTICVECNGLTGTGIYFTIPAKLVENSGININKYVNTMIAI